MNDTYRLASFAYPNNQRTTFDYFDNAGDKRLKQIWHEKPGGAPLSKFDYEYDGLGRITKWTQQADAATPQVMDLEYDFEDQLINALIVPQAGSSGKKAYTYSYDAMGNRKSEQIDTLSPSQVFTVSKSTYNNVNQLSERLATGPLRFKGGIDEPGTVTVNGQPAKMAQPDITANKGKIFTATVDLQTGNRTVEIVATDLADPTPHQTTENYSLTVAGGVAKTLTYDNKGNCTGYSSSSAPPATYEWDAEDRLVKITQTPTGNPQLVSEFTYGGFSRRGNWMTSSRNCIFVWDTATQR